MFTSPYGSYVTAGCVFISPSIAEIQPLHPAARTPPIYIVLTTLIIHSQSRVDVLSSTDATKLVPIISS